MLLLCFIFRWIIGKSLHQMKQILQVWNPILHLFLFQSQLLPLVQIATLKVIHLLDVIKEKHPKFGITLKN